ncbi:MAG: cytochrome-c peroxidase [Hyphomicrobiaceae bacterium]
MRKLRPAACLPAAFASLLAAGWLAAQPAGPGETVLDFTDGEIRRILSHGPWPMPWSPDPSNRVSGDARAAAFGRKLFFDARLSRDGTVSCATCHDPARGWSDGRHRGRGLESVDRNTQSLLNVRLSRWFGWGGSSDSLWAHSIRPLLDRREMGATAEHVAGVIARDRSLARHYSRVFKTSPAKEGAETVLVDAAKALAAFQETIVSGRTPFDAFRDALAHGDRSAAAAYPPTAQRGLRLFVGKGNCSICHLGANFTNGEFHDIGVPFFVRAGEVDAGRHKGLGEALAGPFNLLGRYNDDPARATGWATRHALRQHRDFGAFKVPSLRNLTATGPYMHHGLLPTLRTVVAHYSELEEERLHVHGERILKPLDLTEQEAAELVAFLETLGPSPAGRR